MRFLLLCDFTDLHAKCKVQSRVDFKQGNFEIRNSKILNKINFGCFEILRICAQVQSRVDEVHSWGKCIHRIIFYQNHFNMLCTIFYQNLFYMLVIKNHKQIHEVFLNHCNGCGWNFELVLFLKYLVKIFAME